MKRFVIFLAGLCLACGLSSCDKDDDAQVVRMTIASQLKPMHDGESGLDLPAMVGKVGDSDRWEFVAPIEGFVFEAGYECRLLVSVTPVRNPPAGAPDVRLALVRLLSKEKRDSEGL